MAVLGRGGVGSFARPGSRTDVERLARFLRNGSDEGREKITAGFQELDSSGDGVISDDEWQYALKALDKDQDGTLSWEEIESFAKFIKQEAAATKVQVWKRYCPLGVWHGSLQEPVTQ